MSVYTPSQQSVDLYNAEATRQRNLMQNQMTGDEASFDWANVPSIHGRVPKTADQIATESAESYLAYQSNMRANDPNAYRQQRLAVAAARNQYLLAGQQAEQESWINNARRAGVSEDAIASRMKDKVLLNSLSGSERLDNYLRRQKGDENTVEDFEFEQDLITKDLQYIEARYGKEVAEYAYQEHKARFGMVRDATAGMRDSNRDFFSWDNFQDSSLAIGSKMMSTVGNVVDAVGLATGLQDAKDVTENPNFWHKGAEGLRGLQTEGHKQAEKRQQAREELRNQTEREKVIEQMGQGKTEQQAFRDVQWENQKKSIMDLFSEDATLFSKAAEVVGDLAVGGVIAKGANMLAQGLTRPAVKKYVQSQLNKAMAAKHASNVQQALKAQQGLTTAGKYQTAKQVANDAAKKTTTTMMAGQQGKSAVNKQVVTATATAKQQAYQRTQALSQRLSGLPEKRANAIAEKVGYGASLATVTAHGSNQEAMDSLKSGYGLVANMDNQTFSNTAKGKEIVSELNEKFGVTSLEEGLQNEEYAKAFQDKKEELAVEASSEAYKNTFMKSLAVNALTSSAELKLAGVGKASKSFKNYIGDWLGNTVKEMGEEFVESYSGDYDPKQAVNTVTGSKVLDPTQTAFASGVKGAITAALGTSGLNALPLGKKAIGAGASQVTKGVQTINNQATQSAQINQNNQFMNTVVTNPVVPPSNTPPSGGSNPTPPNGTPPNNNTGGPSIGNSVKSKLQQAVGIQPTLSTQQQQQLNQQYQQTNTGKATQKIAQQLNQIIPNEDSKIKDEFDTGSVVNHLQTQIAGLPKLIEEAIQKGDTAKADSLIQAQTAFEGALTDLQNAYALDLQAQNDKVYAQYETSLREAQTAIDNDTSLTPEQKVQKRQEVEDALDAKYISIANKLAELEANPIASILAGNSDISSYQIQNNATSLDTQISQAKESLITDNLGTASVQKLSEDYSNKLKEIDSNKKLSNYAKRKLKAQASKDLVSNIQSILNNTDVNASNARESWKQVSDLIESAYNNIDSQDAGLEPNQKHLLNQLVKNIKDIAEYAQNASDKEALALFGKYLGTKTGGYKNKGNIGLLDYVSRALNNKGKLPATDLLRLQHFQVTQDAKLNALENLLETAEADGLFNPDGSINNEQGYLTLENSSLKTSKEMLKQDRSMATQFKTKHELQKYISLVQKDNQDFTKLVDKIFKTNLNKTGINGSRILNPLKDTTRQEKKEEKKPEEAKKESKPSEPVQEKKPEGKQEDDDNFDDSPLEFIDDDGDPFFPTASYGGVQEEGWLGNDGLMTDDDATASIFTPPIKSNTEFSSHVPSEFKEEFKSLGIAPDVEFTDQQWLALYNMNEYLSNPEENPYGGLTVAGYAGTGKTFMVSYLFKYRQAKAQTPEGISGFVAPAYVTPTHAAGVQIATKSNSKYQTTKSLLATLKGNNSNILAGRVIVIDEASMVSRKELNDIKKAMMRAGVGVLPIIMMGDPMQLPPVNSEIKEINGNKYQEVAPAFLDYPVAELTEVKRTSNSELLDVLTAIRRTKEGHTGYFPYIESKTGVIQYYDSNYDNNALDTFTNNFLKDFANGSTKLITHANEDVTRWNNYFRQAIKNYSVQTPIQEGETVIGYVGNGSKQLKESLVNSLTYTVKRINKYKENNLNKVTLILEPSEEVLLLEEDAVPSSTLISLDIQNDSIKTELSAQEVKENYEYLATKSTKILNDLLSDLRNNNTPTETGVEFERLGTLYSLFFPTASTDYMEKYYIQPIFEDNVPLDRAKVVGVKFTTDSKALSKLKQMFYAPYNGKSQLGTSPYQYYALFGEGSLSFTLEKGIGYDYAVTTHKSQGMTIDNVYYVPSYSSNMQDKVTIIDGQGNHITSVSGSLNYVGASRTAKKLHVFNDSKQQIFMPINRLNLDDVSLNTEVQTPVITTNSNLKPTSDPLQNLQDLIDQANQEQSENINISLQDYKELASQNGNPSANYEAQLESLPTSTQEAVKQIKEEIPEPRIENIYAGSNENTDLSNLYPFPIEFRGIQFESVEHAYQALKQLDDPLQGEITKAVLEWTERNRERYKSLQGALDQKKDKVTVALPESHKQSGNNIKLLQSLMFVRSGLDINFYNRLNVNTKFTHQGNSTNKISQETENIYGQIQRRIANTSFAEHQQKTKDYLNNLPTYESKKKEAKPSTKPSQQPKSLEEIRSNSPITTNVAITSNSLESTVNQDIWSKSTGDFIQGELTANDIMKARLSGLDVSINQGNLEVNNVLNHPDVTIKEVTPYSQQEVKEDLPSQAFNKVYLALRDTIKNVISNAYLTTLVGRRTGKTTHGLTGFLNLVGIETNQNGEPILSIPEVVLDGMAKTMLEQVKENRSTQSSSMVAKNITNDGQYSLFIQEMTLSTPKNEQLTPENNTWIGKSHKDTLEAYSAYLRDPTTVANTVQPTEGNLATLGTQKGMFIQQLGQRALRHMGISYKEDSVIELDMKALENAVGLEIYNVLLNLGVLRVMRTLRDSNLGNSVTNAFEGNPLESREIIDYISFKWDSFGSRSLTEAQKRNQSIVYGLKRELDENSDFNSWNNLVNQNIKPSSSGMAVGLTAKSLPLLASLGSLSSEQGQSVLPKPEKEKVLKGVSLTEPFKVKSKNVANKTATGNNDTAQEAVQLHNNIPYGFNSDYINFALSEQNQEALLAFLGQDEAQHLPSTVKSNEGRYNGFKREIDTVNEVYGSLEAKDQTVYLKHKMGSQQRVFVDSSLNPQANKIVREALLPKYLDKNGKPLGYGFKNTGSILEVVDEAIEMVSSPYDVSNVDPLTDRYINVTGFALALAQAFDIKIENLYEKDALNQLKDKLKNPTVQEMIDTIVDNLKSGKELNKDVLRKASEFGLNTPRGFNALLHIANYNIGKTNSKGLFQPNLMIEADGKGNGVNNGTNQFTAGFSTEYFNNKKRTGEISLDLIAQAISQGKSIDEIEGTKFLFDKNAPDVLQDVYEVVSNQVSNKITNTIKNLGNPFKNMTLAEFAKSYKELKDNIQDELTQFNSAERRAELKQDLNTLNTFGSVIIADMLGYVKGDIDYNVPLNQLNVQSIARGLAKLAVTPANYGGRVTGISNQIKSDVKSVIRSTTDKLYQQRLANPDMAINDSIEFTKLKTLFSLFDIQRGLSKQKLNTIQQAISDGNTDLVNQELASFLESFNQLNGQENLQVNSIISSTISKFFDEAINEVYGSQFTGVRSLIVLDTAMFNNFISEYTESVRQFILNRNLRNQWSKLDENGNEIILNPKAYNFISKNQLRNILRGLKVLPNVATAMSNNDRLVSNLLDSGNSLTQEDLRVVNPRNQAIVQSVMTSPISSNSRTGLHASSEVAFKNYFESYSSAGASLLVSMLVSTEASVQARTAKELAKDNLYVQDVFDGIETLPNYRFKVGEIANREHMNVHNETNLLGSYYDYVSRSNTLGFIESVINKNTLPALEKTLSQEGNTVRMSVDQINGIYTGLSSLGYLHSFYPPNKKELNANTYVNAMRDTVQSLVAELSLGKPTAELQDITLSSTQKDALQMGVKLLKANLNKIPTGFELLRDNAIQAEIRKGVEQKFLSSVVNQFGGINSGYVHSSKESEATTERFVQFLNNNDYGDIDTQHFRTDSRALNDFIQQDKIIQEYSQKERTRLERKYPSMQTSESEADISNVKNTKELMEVLNNEATDETSFEGQNTKLATELVSDLLTNAEERNNGQPLLVTQDKSELSGLISETNQEILNQDNVQGLYTPQGIYIDPKADKETALHELVHYGLNDYIYTYYRNARALPAHKAAAIRLIEQIMLDMARNFANNPKFAQVLAEIHKASDFNVNRAYTLTPDRMIATMANIQYVFSKAFAEKNDKATVLKARAKVMQEFMAYGLTTLDMMNYMRSRGLKNRSEVLAKTGMDKVWDQLENAFKNLYRAFLSIFGINKDSKTDLDESYLSDLVRSINVISLSNVDGLFKDDTATAQMANVANVNKLTALSNNQNTVGFIQDMETLYTNITEGLNSDKIKTFSDAYQRSQSLDTNQDMVNDRNLLNQQVNHSPLEDRMFELMYYANSQMSDFNIEFNKEVLKTLSDIEKAVFKSGNKQLEKLFKLSPIGSLTAIQTNESIRKDIEQLSLSNTQGSKLLDALNKVKGFNKHLSKSQMSKESYDKLAIIGSKLLFDAEHSLVIQAKNLAREQRKEEMRNKAYLTLHNLADNVPVSSISTLSKLAVEEFFSGNTEQNQETRFGTEMNKLAQNSAALAGRQTAISSLIRLFQGAVKSTQYIYDLQNRASTVNDNIREQYGAMIYVSMEKQFSKPLTKEQLRAISRGYLNGNLYALTLSNDFDLQTVLSSESDRQAAISVVRNKLLNEYEQYYSSNQLGNIQKYIDWQIKGLAEKNMTGLSKAVDSKSNSWIMPNTRAIAGLRMFNQSLGLPNNHFNNLSTLDSLMNELLALESIPYMSKEHKQEVIKLNSKEKAGIKAIANEYRQSYVTSYNQHKQSYLGISNYKYSRINPNTDYQIVDPIKDKDKIERLTYLGYEPVKELPNNLFVMRTNQALNNSYTDGILSLIETSIEGVDAVTNKPIQFKGKETGKDVSAMNKEFDSVLRNVLGSNNYYSSLTDSTNTGTLVDSSGLLSEEFVDVGLDDKESFLDIQEDSFDHIANKQSRHIEEIISQRNNKYYVDRLNQAYKADPNKHHYIKLDGNVKPRGNSAEDIRSAKAMNDFYNSLPSSTQEYIQNNDGLYVLTHELNNIIGYSTASVSDIFTGKSGLPQPIQNAVKATMDAIILKGGGKSPAKLLRQTERLVGDVASWGKDVVLNKSFIVPAQNLLSNIIHLAMVGVPVTQIPRLLMQGYEETKLYNKYREELFHITHELDKQNLPPAHIQRYQNRKKQLRQMLDKLNITPLMEAGIYSNISNQEVNKTDFSMLKELGDKFGLTDKKEMLPTFVKEGLVMEGSKLHGIMEEFMNYGDFVAKFALHEYLTKQRGFSFDRSLNIIRDEFIDYTMNRGRTFDWLNKSGFTWFLSYKLSIQKVIYRNLRQNTLRTLAVWQGANMLNEANIPYVSNLVQTVPQQRLWTDYSGYHFEMDNLFDSFGSHWLLNINKLLP